MLALFRMAMGNFDMSWFEHTSEAISSVAVALFVSFMLFFFLVCVNVLIAVVADSYDYALFRARKIYLRTKLQLVAEFEAVGLTTLPFTGNGFFVDKCVLRFLGLVFFKNPLMLPLTLVWAKTLQTNPHQNDENQDDWDGRMRFFETRMSEVVDHRSAQTERRVAETERRVGKQIQDLRTEVTQMRGQLDEVCAMLRSLAAQRADDKELVVAGKLTTGKSAP